MISDTGADQLPPDAKRAKRDDDEQSVSLASLIDPCSICAGRLVPPTKQCANGHVFCNGCLTRMLPALPRNSSGSSGEISCPNCACKSTFCISNKYLDNLLEDPEIAFNCDVDGCGFLGSYLAVCKHEPICPFKAVPCPLSSPNLDKVLGNVRPVWRNCEKSILHKDVIAHLLADHAPFTKRTSHLITHSRYASDEMHNVIIIPEDDSAAYLWTFLAEESGNCTFTPVCLYSANSTAAPNVCVLCIKGNRQAVSHFFREIPSLNTLERNPRVTIHNSTMDRLTYHVTYRGRTILGFHCSLQLGHNPKNFLQISDLPGPADVLTAKDDSPYSWPKEAIETPLRRGGARASGLPLLEAIIDESIAPWPFAL